jgi:hypothetical protein
LPFKCNLQRYTVSESWDKIMRWSRRVDSKNEKLEDVLGGAVYKLNESSCDPPIALERPIALDKASGFTPWSPIK